MPPEHKETHSDHSSELDARVLALLGSIHQLNVSHGGQQQLVVNPGALNFNTEDLEIMRSIVNTVGASSARRSTSLRTRFAVQIQEVFGRLVAFMASVYAILVKAKPLVLLLKFVLFTVVSVFVFLSSSVPRAIDGHKKLCALSFVASSPICASYASLNLTVLDLRRPGYQKLSDASQKLLEWGEELRLDAIATSHLKTQLDLASAKGIIELPMVEDISGKLDAFEVDLRRTAEGTRNVSAELIRFLDNLQYDQASLVKRIEITHFHAKNSFISRITSGYLVPNYSANIIKMFEQTHEATYTSILNAIALVERMKTLLIICQGDAKILTDIIAKELLQLKTEVDAHNARGIFSQLHAKLSDAMNSKNSALELEAREEQLDDIDDVTKDALEDMENLLVVLNGALQELEDIRKYSMVQTAIDPQMPVDVQLAIARDMAHFGGQRPDLGAAYAIL